MSEFINNQRFAQLAGVNFDSEKIATGPILYSRTHTVVKQFPQLAKYPPCVLITSFSDAHLTDAMAARLPSNVLVWFSNNVEAIHPRVQPVPIGLRTSPEGEKLLRTAMELGRGPSLNLMYLNFWRRLSRRPQPRVGLYEQFAGKSWVTAEGGMEHVPMPQFYERIATHPYVLSPPGAGDDCHRHWESILLGSIPIVLRSPVTRILDGLPCLQVDNWAEVTEEKLLGSYEHLYSLFNSPRMEILWFDYWQKKILEALCKEL